jgi:hypothetical protein
MKLRAFAQGIKPEYGADDKYNDGIGYENPVENNEANRDMTSLDDCPDRQEAGEQEPNTHDKAS